MLSSSSMSIFAVFKFSAHCFLLFFYQDVDTQQLHTFSTSVIYSHKRSGTEWDYNFPPPSIASYTQKCWRTIALTVWPKNFRAGHWASLTFSFILWVCFCDVNWCTNTLHELRLVSLYASDFAVMHFQHILTSLCFLSLFQSMPESLLGKLYSKEFANCANSKTIIRSWASWAWLFHSSSSW